MKVLSLAAATALLANRAVAHYVWTELEIDGTNGVGAEGGIRQHTNGNSPVTGKTRRATESGNRIIILTHTI